MAHRKSDTSSTDLVAHIKHIYHTYRHTADPDGKGLFISPACLQICRPKPSFAATTRKEIVQYLKDAQQPLEKKGKGFYTIRPLDPSDRDFGTNEVTASVKLIVEDLTRKSEQEKWIGMRVDLWFEGGAEKGGHYKYKVRYWWRREDVPVDERLEGEDEGSGWRQCFHDIIYMGPKDGTEGEAGVEVLE